MKSLRKKLSSVWKRAALVIDKQQGYYKKQHDKKVFLPSFEVGDLVMLRLPPSRLSGVSKKLMHAWRAPFRIAWLDSHTAKLVPAFVHNGKEKHYHLRQIAPYDGPDCPPLGLSSERDVVEKQLVDDARSEVSVEVNAMLMVDSGFEHNFVYVCADSEIILYNNVLRDVFDLWNNFVFYFRILVDYFRYLSTTVLIMDEIRHVDV